MTKELFFGIGYARYLAEFAQRADAGRLMQARFPYGPYSATFDILSAETLLSQSTMRFLIDFGERQVSVVRSGESYVWEVEPNSAEIIAMALLAH